jgi:hypothetical protein
MGSYHKGQKCSTKKCKQPASVKDKCGPCYQRERYLKNRTVMLARSIRHDAKQVAQRKRVEQHEIRKLDLLTGRRVTSRFLALQALSAAKVADARTAALMTQLGLNAPTLPRDPGSMVILLNDMLQPIEYIHISSPEYIRYWGGVLFGMDEVYLDAVGVLLSDREPWRLLTHFANCLTRALHTTAAEALARSETLQLAERYFAAAKRHLWHISYVFCRRVHGRETADGVFGGKPNAVNELYALLH